MLAKLIFDGTLETIWMVFTSTLIATLSGIPLGLLIHSSKRNIINKFKAFFSLSDLIINAWRSVPFIILLILILPLTRFLTGTSIGTTAAIVPLAACAIPFVARLTDDILGELPEDLIELGLAMGASPVQIMTRILLPEACPGLVGVLTLTTVNLVSYSAMAGAVGGRGLGDLAIRYGYQRYNPEIMVTTLVAIIILVQLIQYVGNRVSASLRKNTRPV